MAMEVHGILRVWIACAPRYRTWTRSPPDSLRSLILAQHQELLAAEEQLLAHKSEIEHLKLLLAKLAHPVRASVGEAGAAD